MVQYKIAKDEDENEKELVLDVELREHDGEINLVAGGWYIACLTKEGTLRLAKSISDDTGLQVTETGYIKVT